MADNRVDKSSGLTGGIKDISGPRESMAGYDDLHPLLREFLQDAPLDISVSDTLYFQRTFGVQRALQELYKLLDGDFPGYQPPKPKERPRINSRELMLRRW